MDATVEFPFVDRLPKREQSKLSRIWAHFEELLKLRAKHGALIPPNVAAEMLGVSYQRVHQLIQEGRLERVNFLGHGTVTEVSIREYAKANRGKGGRPRLRPVLSAALEDLKS